MNNKKKLIILSSIILGVLVVVVGVAYAAFTYDRIGNNSDLVLGDIYMHYKENNQLTLKDAMPTSIAKYTTYKVNPVMPTQEIVDNELSRCISIYTDFEYEFDAGSTAESFCKGTGTAFGGMTIQEDLYGWISWSQSESTIEEGFLNSGGQELLDAGVILQDGDTYIVNPVMSNQEYIEPNELTRCIDFFGNESFDEGSTAESFCRGIGTINGMAIQEYLNDWISWSESESTIEEGFLNDGGQELLNAGVIIKQIENLPYFEFTISGKNTYLDEDIWYEIVLNHGDKHETRTTRIKDELLRFTLVEVIGEDTEIVLFNNRKYNDLSNKKIWVETIKANTTSEINKKYRLYAWISDSTVIGNVNEDYTTEEWNDVFASIKVNVNGDFKEKELLYEEIYDITDASCFETEEITTYTHNANMTDEELNACVTLFQDEWGYPLYNGEDWESFCQGTGTWDFFTFQEYLVDPGNYYSQSELNQLEENNIIIRNETSAAITNYDENCGSDVVIPKIINGYSVTKISYSAFKKKGLTSVVIPNSVTIIGPLAFRNNLLTEVIFEENSNLIFIDDRVFDGTNQIKEVTIPNSVTHLSCTAFNDDVVINQRYSLVCVEEKV